MQGQGEEQQASPGFCCSNLSEIFCETMFASKQAQAAYSRATDVDQSNPQAWQGLAELHTVTGEPML